MEFPGAIIDDHESENVIQQCVWFFGRGVSITCGLNWDEDPNEQKVKSREERIKLIEDNIRAEMNKPQVIDQAKKIYGKLLLTLNANTNAGWKHLFITTNWDYLLMREIKRLFPNNKSPHWLDNGYVYHINGTVEDGGAIGDRRSQLILADDKPEIREEMIKGKLPEFNMAYAKMRYNQIFLVIGVSFAYEVDEIILVALNLDIRDMETQWIIVDPKCQAVGERIRKKVPQAKINVAYCIEDFLYNGIRIKDLEKIGLGNSNPIFKK